ncbi:aldose epimerase family protein [Listeria sp. ILCC797]|uniref:aldose epimerase family protein n=1 Tax=Listeria sp. ILCC797 TaxID=1918333 RepID=UPI000B5880B0|nr:aldose epimerase family protein [Listeria sp. ILCC797]
MKRIFGEIDGVPIYEYTLKNNRGTEFSALNYGGIVTRIVTEDRFGEFQNISLGFDNLADYLAHSPYFGAFVGRVAGRIRNGTFVLDGKQYDVVKNNGNHQLHGGRPNFSKAIFQVEEVQNSLIFSYKSPAFENGYPGEVDVVMRYTLTDDDAWVIEYEAKTDQPTLFNPTNHTYFNLSGDVKKAVFENELFVRSHAFACVDADLVPTGEIRATTGTAFDFTAKKQIQDAISKGDPQIDFASGGLDHGFVLEHEAGQPDAVLMDAETGRGVAVQTDAPAVVIYTGNTLFGDYKVFGETIRPFSGITFETQILPDAIHHPHFGDSVLRPEKPFYSKTTFRFFVNKA